MKVTLSHDVTPPWRNPALVSMNKNILESYGQELHLSHQTWSYLIYVQNHWWNIALDLTQLKLNPKKLSKRTMLDPIIDTILCDHQLLKYKSYQIIPLNGRCRLTADRRRPAAWLSAEGSARPTSSEAKRMRRRVKYRGSWGHQRKQREIRGETCSGRFFEGE